MQQYQYKGEFHYIYDNYKEFREHQPFEPYHKYYWHLGILKPMMWTSTADGFIVQVLSIRDNPYSKVVQFPFKQIRISSKYNEATKGYIWVPSPKLYYNKLLEKTITPKNGKAGGMTRKQMDDILVYIKLTGDIWKSITRVMGKELTSSNMSSILAEIEAKEPHIMDEIKEFMAGVEDKVFEKTGKTLEEVMQDSVAELLTDKKQYPADKRANIVFAMKLKYMSREQFIGITPKGKNLKNIQEAQIVPPLLK